MWIMNMHYDYSKEHHYKDEENPLSYTAYALQHGYNDGVSAYNKTMKASDHVVADLKGEPYPETVEPERHLPPRYIPREYAQREQQPAQTYMPQAASVMVCVPNDLVAMWDNTAAYPKMSAYKDLMATFIKANGRAGNEYFVGNFDIYEPGVTDPSVLVSAGDARQGCPVGFQAYNLPLNPK
jgi:hypothetical protein